MIDVTDLSKHYGKVRAVDGISFTVPDGFITGFLGPNGAGKSTAVRCMLGLDRPTSGRVLIDGAPLSQHDRPATVAGASLGTSWFHPGRTGLAHLEVAALSAGLPRHAVAQALGTVGMTSASRRPIGTYSLGMKQRLSIATAMLGHPRNVILDEPMNGLDPQGMEWMRGYLRTLAEQGHAVLVSSHLLSEMETLADRLLIVGRGRLLGEWDTTDLVRTRTREALISTHDDARLVSGLRDRHVTVRKHAGGLHVTFNDVVADVLALSRLCAELGVLITALGRPTVRLDELFLDLTGASAEYRAGEDDRP